MDTSKISCPVELTMSLICNKWKIYILRDLLSGTKRFGELQRSVTGVSQKMLTQQLRSLEKDGVINRVVYPQVPPKVEYSMTELGVSLAPVLMVLSRWGMAYKQKFDLPVADNFPQSLPEVMNSSIDLLLAGTQMVSLKQPKTQIKMIYGE